MKTYVIHQTYVFTVEAESEDKAHEKALQMADRAEQMAKRSIEYVACSTEITDEEAI